MIVKETKYTPLYQQLGLFTEAPRRKRRPRVITVRASRAKDYTDGIEPEEDIDVGNNDDDYDDVTLDEPDDDDGGDNNADNDTDTGNDNTDDGDATNDDNTDGDNPDTDNDNTDTEDSDTGGNGDDNNEETDGGNDGENIDVGGDNGGGDDNEDYTDGADDGGDGDDGTSNNENDDGGDGGGDNDNEGSNDSFNKNDMRKFKLFEKFEQIHQSITYLISKMESIISDDIVVAEANNHALKSFTRLAAVARDYMVLKFRSDSYPQNKYMYERLRAATLLTVESLNIRKNDKSK